MTKDLRFCLVVVFNHRFERNLPVLRALYRGRFSTVRFLVPFYRGDDPDVLPVFASSATFQGYFAQAQSWLSGEGFSHYVFIADDLLLDPQINETNLAHVLRLAPGTGYIKSLVPFSSLCSSWAYFDLTLRALDFTYFINAREELPARGEALSRLAGHGMTFRPLGWRNLAAGKGAFWQRTRDLLAAAFLVRTRRELAYPLVMGYADLLIVPSNGLAEFCHLCGVFAAMNIFVECAAPTALALAVPDLRFESDLAVRGLELWSDADRIAFRDRYSARLDEVTARFPGDTLYVHPIKLSQWAAA